MDILSFIQMALIKIIKSYIQLVECQNLDVTLTRKVWELKMVSFIMFQLYLEEQKDMRLLNEMIIQLLLQMKKRNGLSFVKELNILSKMDKFLLKKVKCLL